MLTASSTDGPVFHSRSCTQNSPPNTTSTPHPDTAPQISEEPTTAPKPLMADYLEALLQIQKTDLFCNCISRRLLNGKAPHHEFDTFVHVKGLLSQMLARSFLLWSFLNLGNIQYSLMLMTNWATKVIHIHIVLSNATTIGKGWTRILGNILQTVFFADRRKQKFNNTHYRWLQYQIDHLIK